MKLQRRLRTAFTKPFKRKKFEFQKKSKKIFEKLLTFQLTVMIKHRQEEGK